MNLYSWFSDFFKQLNVIVLTTFWLCINCKYRYPTKDNSLAYSWLSRAYYASTIYYFTGHFGSIFAILKALYSVHSSGHVRVKVGMSLSFSFCAHSFAKPFQQTSTTRVFFHSASTVFVRWFFSYYFFYRAHLGTILLCVYLSLCCVYSGWRSGDLCNRT